MGWKKINKFLDAILDFKKKLNAKTLKTEAIVEKVEEITWFNDLDNEYLMLIHDLISAIRDALSSLIRQYVSFDFFRFKGITKEEIKSFKSAIDDLKDVANDLESVFFFLPEFEGFKETTRELSLV